MSAVFLDYATVDDGDLDPRNMQASAPGLRLLANTPQSGVVEAIKDCEIVLLNKLKITADVMAASPKLRLIALSATGTNNIDLVAAAERGIAVCNIRDYCTPSVVQHVLGTLLMLTHRLREYSKMAVDGTWSRSQHFTLLTHPIRELQGLTLGIVGYGVLGQAVANACQSALGMKVLVAHRHGEAAQAGRVALEDLLQQADVVSLHCPLTEQTRHLLDARRLSLMKRDAILINTARGALVDLEALAAALREGRLGGAAIDVLPEEPPVSGSPLFADDLPNLIVTPHTAWAARDSRQRCLDEIAANISDWRKGGRRGRVV
ncbi:MAG: D-2-hydroxyacid dehydrogenase [Steroidobacteraceae bacterium]|jgi:glycerate dehydrogenase